MESSIRTHLQQHESSSRLSKNLTFVISSIIIFIFILGAIASVSFMLKLEVESQALSAKPSLAVSEVCQVMPYFDSGFFFSGTFIEDPELISRLDNNHVLCFDSISSLFNQNYKNRISPSDIFHLSLQVSITNIKNLQNELGPKGNCKKLINDSKSQLDRSLTLMVLDQSESILRDEKLVNDMRSWIKNALANVDLCLAGIKDKRVGRLTGVHDILFKINMAKAYLGNCLGILDNLEEIFGRFYPSIGRALGIDLLYSTAATVSNIGFFCSQYLMLIIIVGVFLHVWRRN